MPTTTATTHQSALLLVPPRDDASSNDHHHNTNEYDDYDDGSSLESTRCVHADDDDKPCTMNSPPAPITPKQQSSKKSVRFCPDDQNRIHAEMLEFDCDNLNEDMIWYSPDELSSFKRRAQRMADRIQDKAKWLPPHHVQSPHQFLSALQQLLHHCTQHQEQQQQQQEAEQEQEDEQEQPEEEQDGDSPQDQPQHKEQQAQEEDPFTLPSFVQPLLDRLVQWYALANPQQSEEDGPSLLSMSSHDSSHASSSSPTKTSLPLECIGLEGFVSTAWSRDAAQRRRAICRVVHHITEEYELGFWTADELPAGYQTCCRRISQVHAIMAHVVALAQWQASSSFD